MRATGEMFRCLSCDSAVWAHITNRSIPKGLLAIGSAPPGYLLGDKDPEHLFVARHCLTDSVLPNEVKILGINNVL